MVSKASSCSIPLCAACQYGKAHLRAKPGAQEVKELDRDGILRAPRAQFPYVQHASMARHISVLSLVHRKLRNWTTMVFCVPNTPYPVISQLISLSLLPMAICYTHVAKKPKKQNTLVEPSSLMKQVAWCSVICKSPLMLLRHLQASI